MFGLSRSVTSIAAAFIRDDRGGDLIEYALLTGLIALSGALAFRTISGQMSTNYHSWDTTQQGLYSPPDPATTP